MLRLIPVPFSIPPLFLSSVMIIVMPIEDLLIPPLFFVLVMISKSGIKSSICHQKNNHTENNPFLYSVHVIPLSDPV